jgi:hypothetical protein
MFVQGLRFPKFPPVFKYLVDDFTVIQIADMDFVLVSVSLKAKNIFVHRLDHGVEFRNGPRMTINNELKLAIRPDAGTVGRDGVSLLPRKIYGVFKSFAGVAY